MAGKGRVVPHENKELAREGQAHNQVSHKAQAKAGNSPSTSSSTAEEVG